MVQLTGETRDAIIQDDNEVIQEIVSRNKANKNPYWIVVFAKPSDERVEGRPVMVKLIKPYSVRPPSWVGAIIGEVDNLKGTITWEVNMPQKPFDFDRLPGAGKDTDKSVVVETTTIPGSYVIQ